jgi:hypothetical protein
MILAALLLAAPLQCGAVDSHLPRDLSGWARTGSGLDTGHAITLTGRRNASVETSITIRKAGVFGIAVDQQAWVDVYRGRGKPLRMAYESGGPGCTSIRKIVRYRLAPGSYRVVVSKLASDRVKLMLVYRQPGRGAGPAARSRVARRG